MTQYLFYLLKIVEINMLFPFVFGFSVLLSVALDSRCGLCNVSPTLGRRLVTVWKQFGLHQCSSVKANVTVPPLPILKVSFPWRRGPWSLVTHLYWFPGLKEPQKTSVVGQFVQSICESSICIRYVIIKPKFFHLTFLEPGLLITTMRDCVDNL